MNTVRSSSFVSGLTFIVGMACGSLSLAEGSRLEGRVTIDMPPPVVATLRGEMVDMLISLQRVMGLMAENRFMEAGDVAENHLGRTAMMQHQTRGAMMPGMFMPQDMRHHAGELHRLGSELALALRMGNDRRRMDVALAQLLSTCTACHQTFQIRRIQ